jgi:hypothetical protein
MHKQRQRALESSARLAVVGRRRARFACNTGAIGAARGVELRRRAWRGCSAGSGERTALGGGE